MTDHPPSEVLQKVSLPIIDDSSCARKYRKYQLLGWFIADSMICAGFDEGGKGAYYGDSGGPLFDPETGVSHLR